MIPGMVVGLLVVTCVAFAALPDRATPGTEVRTLSFGGRERSYRVHAPSGTSGPRPVLFVFHGGGGKAVQVERYTRFSALADREGFLAVYPESSNGNWNDGREADLVPTDVDDVGFVRAVLEQVAAAHPVDRARVYATGISNGAIMSHLLAADASDAFVAVGPVVGGMAEPLGKRFHPTRPVSLVVIQGDQDPLVPIGGGPVVAPGRKYRGRVLSLDQAVARYLDRNGIQGTPEVTDLADKDSQDGTATRVTDYPAGEQGARVRVYRVAGGGHTLPGRPNYLPEALIGKTSQDFDGAEALWAFFASCPPRR